MVINTEGETRYPQKAQTSIIWYPTVTVHRFGKIVLINSIDKLMFNVN